MCLVKLSYSGSKNQTTKLLHNSEGTPAQCFPKHFLLLVCLSYLNRSALTVFHLFDFQSLFSCPIRWAERGLRVTSLFTLLLGGVQRP